MNLIKQWRARPIFLNLGDLKLGGLQFLQFPRQHPLIFKSPKWRNIELDCKNVSYPKAALPEELFCFKELELCKLDKPCLLQNSLVHCLQRKQRKNNLSLKGNCCKVTNNLPGFTIIRKKKKLAQFRGHLHIVCLRYRLKELEMDCPITLGLHSTTVRHQLVQREPEYAPKNVVAIESSTGHSNDFCTIIKSML